MTKIRYIAIMAMVIIFATTAVFVGCEKKENPVVEQRKDALKKQKEQQEGQIGIYVTQITLNKKGKGAFGKKVCVEGGSECWIWWRTREVADADIKIWAGFKWTYDDNTVTAIATNPDPENSVFPKRITLEFPNEWNEASALDNFFNGRYDVFVVDEDMVEGGESSLLEMLGVDFPCVIKAGEYPMYMNDEGNYVVELMVEQFFFEVGTNPALRLQIGDQHHYSGYSEFSQLYELYGYSNVIYAECLRELNNNPEAITMMEHFISTNKFVVNQDIIVDEDSYLWEVFPYPCVIRAGEYPIYTADGDDFVIAFAVEPL